MSENRTDRDGGMHDSTEPEREARQIVFEPVRVRDENHVNVADRFL